MSDDITFCADADQCQEKNKCRRAESPVYKEYVSYSDFYALRRLPQGISGCEYFMKGRIL